MPRLNDPGMSQFLALARQSAAAPPPAKPSVPAPAKPAASPAASTTDLAAMQEAIKTATSAGDEAEVARLQKEFHTAFMAYAHTHTMSDALQAAKPGKQAGKGA